MELEFFIRPDEVVEAISGQTAKGSEIGNRKSEIENALIRVHPCHPE
jgi:hypothetical protein